MEARERLAQRLLRRQVRKALDFNVLAWFCTASEDDFRGYGDHNDLGRGDFYIHRNNEAPVLGVAHLDTVSKQRGFYHHTSKHGDIIYAPTLDDRLGAYVICELLSALGVNVDVLLTTGEEWCQSTAYAFQADKRYNWAFSFDRMGTDVVMYHYSSPRYRALLRELGAELHHGSYSDIADLDIGCVGFNWGVGYHNYHDPAAYALVDELVTQVARFLRFYSLHSSEHFAYSAPRWTHTPYVPAHTSEYYQWPNGAYWSSRDSEWKTLTKRLRCPDCGDTLGDSESGDDYGLCGTCGYDRFAPYGRHSSLHNLTDEEIAQALN